MPVGMNFAPYGGDIHVMPLSRHDSMSRPSSDYHPANSVPVTTTTYAVRKDRDPPPPVTSGREDRGRVHRSSTIDSSTSKRPPIIVTTKHPPPGSHALPNVRGESPTRDPYRSSEEGSYLTQPASSVSRSRSTTRAPFSAALDNDDYARLRERTGDERLHSSRPAEYRPPPRPVPLYHHMPPRPTSAIDYGDEGYEYTKPSDLARYDLDTTRPHRPRRESFDRNYYRPSVSVTTDIGRPYEPNDRRQRGPPPTTRGLDRVNRNSAAGIYDPPQIRMPIPPPVPLAPDPSRRSGHHLVPGSPTAERRRSSSRTRPVSLYQEGPGWPHVDDPYRSREDPLVLRDHRERDPKYFPDDSVTNRGFGIRLDTKEPDEYRRDFDTRHRDERRERRESRREFDDREPKRRSDEEVEIVKVRDERREHGHREPRRRSDEESEPVKAKDGWREHDHREPRKRSDEESDPAKGRDERREHDHREHDHRKHEHREHRSAYDDVATRQRNDTSDKEPSVHEDGDRERKKDKIKEKVTTGLELAAASIGIGAVVKNKDGRGEKDNVSPSRTRKDDEDEHHRGSDDSDARSSSRRKPADKEAAHRQPTVEDEVEAIEPPRGRIEPPQERERERDRDHSRRERPVEVVAEPRDRDHRQAEAKPREDTGEHSSRDQSTSEEDGRTKQRSRRRHTATAAFDPNDAAGLMALKAQLAATESKDKISEKAVTKAPDTPIVQEPSPPSSPDVDKHDAANSETQLVVTKDEDDYDDDSHGPRGRELVPPPHEERQVRVVSPPREKDERKPIKGILKTPSSKFPEEKNPIREGVAPHKDDKTKANVPPGARWTKINRQLVNPEALTIGKERFEVRDDFVIVLRVLSKEEIQAYATATAQLRGL